MIRTAEFVTPKHPDKLCDRISDLILDLYLTEDPNSRCAIETCGGHGKVFITGEVTSNADVCDNDIKTIVYNVAGIEDVTIHLVKQSLEIAQGVDTGGAGDQGIMIGYACSENEEYLPQEYYLARKLCKKIWNVYPFDGKTQVTLIDDTKANTKVRVVASFQNSRSNTVRHLINSFFSDYDYEIESVHVNPAGEWKSGGFDADAGVTGRKLAVDNYGPRIPLGGGAFSGKDATKVDRSAAYMARRIAVQILKEKNAKEVKVELAYAIGYDEPLHASATIDGKQMRIFNGAYNLTPKGIIDTLNLKNPIFSQTSEWGHMGNNFPWG